MFLIHTYTNKQTYRETCSKSNHESKQGIFFSYSKFNPVNFNFIYYSDDKKSKTVPAMMVTRMIQQ